MGPFGSRRPRRIFGGVGSAGLKVPRGGRAGTSSSPGAIVLCCPSFSHSYDHDTPAWWSKTLLYIRKSYCGGLRHSLLTTCGEKMQDAPPTRQHKGTKGKGAEQTKTNTKGTIKKGLKTKNGHFETIRPQCKCVSYSWDCDNHGQQEDNAPGDGEWHWLHYPLFSSPRRQSPPAKEGECNVYHTVMQGWWQRCNLAIWHFWQNFPFKRRKYPRI